MATLQKIRSKGPLLVVVIGLALFAFIASDAWRALQPHTGSQNVGEIDGETISAQDFQKMVEEYSDVYKFTRQVTSLSDDELTQVKDEVWNTLVTNKLLEKEAKKLGLQVTDAEVKAIITEGKHPLLQQTPFFNQQTGTFDVDVLKKFLDDVSKMDMNQMPQQYVDYYLSMNNYWTFIEKSIRDNALMSKYQNLVAQSLISNPIEAKDVYEGRTSESNLLLAAIPYTAIADSTVKISDSDLKDLYNKKKEQFKQYAESRDIKYIDVLITPSKEDRNQLLSEVTEFAEQLSTTNSEIAAFIRSTGSSVLYSEVPSTVNAYPTDIANKLDSVAIGEVYGPFYNQSDDSYNAFKVVAKVNEPDSVQFRLIQVAAESKEQTETLADSIYNAIKGGADFTELAQKYGQSGESNWLTSKQYEGAPIDAENAKYINTLNNSSVNELTNLDLGQVNLIVQVLNRKAITNKYKVAVVKRPVDFSKETYNKAYNAFSQFIASNNTLDKLEANAEENGYRILERKNFYSSEHNVSNIRNTREALRWIFDAKEGEVSPLYECGDNNHLLVVAVSEVNQKGYTPFNKVKEQLRAEAIKNKKAEKLMAEMKSITSFSQAKSITNVVTDTVKHVTFSAPTYVSITRGSEPALGAYALKTEVNKLSAPIKGNSGVYVMQVYSKDKTGGEFNAQNEEDALNAVAMRSVSRFMNDLYLKANVKDERYLFF